MYGFTSYLRGFFIVFTVSRRTVHGEVATSERTWLQQPGETNKAYSAFSVYLTAGSERSTARVAQELGKSKTLMDRWSSRHDWVRRAGAYDAYAIQQRLAVREKIDANEEIRAYRERARENAKRLNAVTTVLLGKAAERLRNLNPSDIDPRLLPGIIRATAQAMDAALNAEAQAIGANDLLQMLDEMGTDEAGNPSEVQPA